MPNISSIPQVLYEPDQPYHYLYDNLPLRNILTRIGLVNIQVDTNTDMLRGAAGTVGSLNARLEVSLNQNGTIKASAVDSSLHGIGRHTDGKGSDGVEYVRMKAEERAKLGSVESQANRLVVEVDDQFPTVGASATISSGTLKLKGSSSILLDFQSPNTVRFHSAFPSETMHRHNYGLTPVLQGSSSSSSGSLYATTSVSTRYMEGTLRVYVNGVRLFRSNVPVPNTSGTAFIPTRIVSENNSDGTFLLNRALSGSDVIRIDFDEKFVS